MKRTAIVLFALAVVLGSTLTAHAGDIDLAKWNDESALYTVFDGEDSYSNSAVVMAFLRTAYDRPSNRIRMLFSLELDSFTDESKSGVRLNVNGGEDIVLHADGTAEYNEEEYFAGLTTDFDPRTKTLYLEVTLGIKKGIPDNLVLNFNFYDTEGLASNTYSVDISETNGQPEPSENVTRQTKKNNTSDKKEPAVQKTQASSQEKSTQAKASTSATQPHNPGGQVINITARDRAFAIIVVIVTVTLVSIGGFYLIRRRNDPKNGG